MFSKKKAPVAEAPAGEPIAAHVANTKILAEHIDKVYPTKKGDVTALSDVSIDIQDNDFVTVVGPSGCGKSTLLRMLAGLDFPSKGRIVIDDRQIAGPGPDRGMVFQTYTLFPWMTVEDNIKFGPKVKGLPRGEQDAIAARYLKVIGLEKFAKAYPKELSGGMRQRVAIARALANSPEVLLMDEPFGALDPHTKSMMQLLMREIWVTERPTVVFITHDIDEAVFLANKVYVMSARPGRVIKEVGVYLPHKRTLALRDTPEFLSIRKRINDLLYGADDRAADAEVTAATA